MITPVAHLARSLTVALLLGCSFAAHAQPAAAPPPIEHFFAKPRLGQMALSPNGKLLAIITTAKGQRAGLRVIDIAAGKGNSAASFGDFDVTRFQWVNDKRLVFQVGDSNEAQGEVLQSPGMYAVNADGSGLRQLAQRDWNGSLTPSVHRVELLPPNVSLSPQPGLQDSDTIYVYNSKYNGKEFVSVELVQVDTVTGRFRHVPGPANVRGWLLDHQGEPRIATSSKEDTGTIHWRPAGSAEWKALTSFNVFTGTEGAFTPLAFAADGTLYVMTRRGDKAGVHTFNTASGKVSDDALIETTGYDFNGDLIMTNGVLKGFRYTTDALSTYWVDPVMRKLQEEIDAKLPGTINTISAPRRPEAPWILVGSFSDKVPYKVALYNKDTKAIQEIGSSRPDIKPEQMGPQEAVSYKSRDGMTIPALLTLPRGKRSKLPLVVLVHGGPYVDGAAWGWDGESQFLASRGYAVLEPSFRGTTGLGYKHYRAGWKQWGLSMQDDIAEGARWAVSQGIADGARICIAGASYGGYATLMGLIKDPELYKCGINWLGVTDISLLHKTHWIQESDISDEYRKYGLPELVGDLVKDAEQIKATSPLVHAAKIKQPLMLAYGGADVRVPLHHGTKFRDAVKAGNANVEWVSYPNEGHGFVVEENRFDFYQRMERFLDRHIGAAAAPAK